MKARKALKFLSLLLVTSLLTTGLPLTQVHATEITDMGAIMSKDVQVDSNFNIPIQDLSKITVTIPANLDLHYNEDTTKYSVSDKITVKGEIANNCLVSVAMSPALEYINSIDIGSKVYAKNSYEQVVKGIAYWDSQTLAANPEGVSEDFTITAELPDLATPGDYESVVDFNIACHIVKTDTALSDMFTVLDGETINGHPTKVLQPKYTAFNEFCANNGGTITLPTFVKVGDEIFPISRFLNNNDNVYTNGFNNGLNALTSLKIPDGVTKLSRAFAGAQNLTSLELPKTLQVIYNNACEKMINITNINIPEGVTSIGGAAFYGCSSLQTVKIPSTVRGIGECAFYSCKSLKEIEIPTGVKYIGSDYYNKDVFSYCSSLHTITLPSTIISMYSSFNGCTSLSTVNYKGTIAQFKNISGLSSLTGSSYNSGDLTVHCTDGDLHYLAGVLQE